MFLIQDKIDLSPVSKEYLVQAPEIAQKAQPGQFVIVRIDEQGERIPLTIADFDRQTGTITLVVQEIGASTKEMGLLRAGDSFRDVVGPLGVPTHIKNYGTVVCIGGGLGIAPVYPITRALKEAGNTIISIIGARSHNLLIWEDKMSAVSDEIIPCTDDGSYGTYGLVTGPLKELLEGGRQVEHCFAIGPAIMMKFVCKTSGAFAVPTTVSINSIMVDGTGMCGACRLTVGGKTRFACVDGPDFDGHLVDWDELLERQRQYLPEEKRAVEEWERRHPCDPVLEGGSAAV
ncbi:MAG: sulfide/dihydroorotate dehydrogenase-like FAD/NAD-binding protein [Chloroflexia bacterium]|nr:sulfide/dihydroorotate dehydrogenase-like FAD/NAD-binding protein [Chloroflexia bacterium]